MAQSINPAGYIEPAVIDNHVQVAAERGYSLAAWADLVEPESVHLAAALRRLAADTPAADAPKGRRSASDKLQEG